MRWGEHLAQDMIAVPLGPAQRYVVSAAPSLVKAVGAPRHPRELLERPCIRLRYPSGTMPPWEFEKAGEIVRIDPPGPLTTSSLSLMRQAALDGVGFWPSFDGYVEDDIAAGRLVSVLEDWCTPFPGPYLYYAGNRTVPPALRAFIDFVKSRNR